jgi:DinB superfamily
MTFEVIDRRSSRIDDHAKEGNQMPTMEEYAGQPREQRMARLTRTADELAVAIKGQSDGVLSRRPDAKNWAGKEIVYHLRDTEEVFAARIEQVRIMDVDPRWGDSNADRMAEERQYLRNDAEEALVAFRRRRAETLELFARLAPGQWEKGGIHPVRGRFTIDAILSIMAWHDDNHLDQLTRALEGRV